MFMSSRILYDEATDIYQVSHWVVRVFVHHNTEIRTNRISKLTCVVFLAHVTLRLWLWSR